MLGSHVTATQKRRALRDRLASGRLTVLPGAFSPLTARAISQAGGAGVYISGHMIAADLGLPDIGLTTLSEVAQRAQQIARMVDVPALVDADTGFGEPANAARTIQMFEDAGIAGCHIEDQINPKRCGHSDGVEVVDADPALRRIRGAVLGRRDPEFVIIARTDARAAVGLDAAIERAQSFVDAGADVIFPEALRSPEEYRRFRAEIDVPLMINLNEFGGRVPLTQQEVRDLGYQLAVYPMTLLRLAMGAVTDGIRVLLEQGTQEGLMAGMQTRDELYALLDYDGHAAFDREVIGR
ncbi:oxaloacetate decarboxylase [Microbacterium sp. 1.5R]|uniref:isocitrate lyase/PEP mutase family protein n=1 Tax=Microbacterium sp. 1.5R TaxID=1916917 RepID=UPI00119F804D|nr:isocitrate lyase/phosphoenolpyruvate mutase family protein [Microbacterium sp. 1.5R]